MVLGLVLVILAIDNPPCIINAVASAPSDQSLFDYLVGASQQRNWDRKTLGLCRLEIDHHLQLRCLLYRQFGRPAARKDAAAIGANQTICFGVTSSVAYQAL